MIAHERRALKNLLFPELTNYWNQFQERFREVREKAKPDAVHDFRVSIRRLRSILLLIKEINPGIDIKSSNNEMKDLMEIFGRLRDLHIQYDLVRKSLSRKQTFLNPWLSDLNSQIILLEKKLQYQVRRANISRTGSLVKKILSYKTFPVSQPNKHIEADKINMKHVIARGILQKYLLRCFSLLPLVKNEDNKAQFHKLRINIKKLRYKLEILHPVVLKQTWKKESLLFRSLQNSMGDVHDIDVAVENIRSFLEEHDPGILKTRGYKTWLAKMLAKRRKLFRNSLTRIKDLEKYDFFSK
ncbi:CHAD domain-containing protein [Candidatus Sumerlaeota bacterium]|nr:CHAD domain-containing protein [Candidatus Sumerlaeota bacterium]